MGKAAIAIGVVATGTLASVGGMYLSKMNSFDSELPKDLKEFEEKGQKEGCIVGLFPDLKNMTSSDTSSEAKLDGTVLGNDNKKDTEGCLVVNWNKENFVSGNDVKWKGGFRFLWSIKNSKNNKGLVVFAVGDPVKGGKVKWTGDAYSLEKNGTDAWKVSKKISIESSGKEVDANGKFPKAKKIKPSYWGFLDEPSGDMSKFCDNGSCTGKPTKPDTSFRGYWTWKGDNENNSENLEEWMENLESWWKETFGETNGKIKDMVKDMKGKWTEQIWYGIDKPKDQKTSS